MNVTGASAASATTIAQAAGQVKYSGGGTYTFMQITGLAQLAANNGFSQTAQFAINNGATLGLNGFNQSGLPSDCRRSRRDKWNNGRCTEQQCHNKHFDAQHRGLDDIYLQRNN